MSSQRKAHAIFEDGSHLTFDWDGWPESLDPILDTPDIEDQQDTFRQIYLIALAGRHAGKAFQKIKVVKAWVESNGASDYNMNVLSEL